MSQFINKREKDELLIELVKSNRSIYDASDKNYKNNIEKDKCWEKISEMIEMSVSECKKRWKSLRDQYNKKKKDYRGTRCSHKAFNVSLMIMDM
ncbi:unnamed protein product [Acanthoscelides obtectus]|uniref:MADF domain-containing protein n=1 Tax=Acanthoscelides obtectus TaxID=200917 RepID=A0A9P0KH49_ACAOB|nr:unnamed protein product [Acanthoscelides obtectus]CAK1651074.1 Transcription factor Adf-1 [Acanthoscelides obtectus]